jgi:hypothetical protein
VLFADLWQHHLTDLVRKFVHRFGHFVRDFTSGSSINRRFSAPKGAVTPISLLIARQGSNVKVINDLSELGWTVEVENRETIY